MHDVESLFLLYTLFYFFYITSVPGYSKQCFEWDSKDTGTVILVGKVIFFFIGISVPTVPYRTIRYRTYVHTFHGRENKASLKIPKNEPTCYLFWFV